MTGNDLHGLDDALALTTNLLYAKTEGIPWTECLLMAREMAERNGGEVLMAQAQITLTLLNFISQVAASAADAGVAVGGIPGGMAPDNLLQEIGRQMHATGLE